MQTCRAIALLALAGAMALACCGLYGYAHPRRYPVVPEQMQLTPHDKPLMTPQERAWAQQSGIGTYIWEGITVVDEGLPEGYWQPTWQE